MLATTFPRELRAIENEFDRLMGHAFANRTSAWVPALDMKEDDDSFVLSLDLPGVYPQDVDVSYEDGTLTISGSRSVVTDKEDDHWHRIERSYGSFARSIRLPKTADVDNIDATFNMGVLNITVPKTEAAKPRRIDVKALESGN